jgi:hypothetical protein
VTGTAGPTTISTTGLLAHVLTPIVRGGRKTVCARPPDERTPQPGCFVITAVVAPQTVVFYTLTYPNTPEARSTVATASLQDRFKDTADAHGNSGHAFAVAYVPPAGAVPGSAATVVHVTVTAYPPGATGAPATVSTRFVVTP